MKKYIVKRILISIPVFFGITLLVYILSSTAPGTPAAMLLGVMSAYKPYSAWDYVSSAFSFIGASMPNFFVGLILIYLFSVRIGILPSSGMFDSSSAITLPGLLKHMLLPMATLCLQQIGSILRQTRGSMLEALGNDFIRTSRAQGLKESAIVIGHGLRNALIPILTVLGGMLPFIVGGAMVTEQLFSWPGLGSLMVQSINSRVYPVQPQQRATGIKRTGRDGFIHAKTDYQKTAGRYR